jgi:NOL1/NOP2/fmu family ribosome biogenesis protein
MSAVSNLFWAVYYWKDAREKVEEARVGLEIAEAELKKYEEKLEKAFTICDESVDIDCI